MGGDSLEVRAAKMEMALRMIRSMAANSAFGSWRQQICDLVDLGLK